jgi:protein-tyrosine phosphatase
MIDMHAHLLPGVDDGPSDWDEALAMLEAGRRDGIRGAVCTSHVLDRFDAAVETKFAAAFSELRRRASLRGIDMELWLGAEIHVNVSFDAVPPAATLAGGGKYLLLELPLNDIPNNADDRLFDLCLKGYHPILAHPERNSVLMQKPELVYSLVQRGVLTQVNAGSLTGDFGYRIRKAAESFVDRGLVHFIGSDCHNLRTRTMTLSAAARAVARRAGAEAAADLTSGNALRALRGESLPASEPAPFQPGRRWFSFGTRRGAR